MGQHKMALHEMALQEVMEALPNLSSNVEQISGRMDKLSTHLTTLTAPVHIPAPAPALAPAPAPPLSHSTQPREPFIPTPVRYSGVVGSCRQFLHQCGLVFVQQPLTYSSDQSRIASVMSYDSFQSFSAEFLKVFDHTPRTYLGGYTFH